MLSDHIREVMVFHGVHQCILNCAACNRTKQAKGFTFEDAKEIITHRLEGWEEIDGRPYCQRHAKRIKSGEYVCSYGSDGTVSYGIAPYEKEIL